MISRWIGRCVVLPNRPIILASMSREENNEPIEQEKDMIKEKPVIKREENPDDKPAKMCTCSSMYTNEDGKFE